MNPTYDTACLQSFEYTVCWKGIEYPCLMWKDWDLDLFTREKNEVRGVCGIVGYKYNNYEPVIKGTFLFPCLDNLKLLFPDLVPDDTCQQMIFGQTDCAEVAVSSGPLVLTPKCAANDEGNITLFNATINVDGSVSGGEGECWELPIEWNGTPAPATLPNGDPNPYAGQTHAIGTLDCTQESTWDCATETTVAV